MAGTVQAGVLTPEQAAQLTGQGISPETQQLMQERNLIPPAPAGGPATTAPLLGNATIPDTTGLPFLEQFRPPGAELASFDPVGAGLTPPVAGGGLAGSPELSGRAPLVQPPTASIEQQIEQSGALDQAVSETPTEDPINFVRSQQPPPQQPPTGGLTPATSAVPLGTSTIVTDDNPDGDPGALSRALLAVDLAAVAEGNTQQAISTAIDSALVTSERDLEELDKQIEAVRNTADVLERAAQAEHDEILKAEIDPDRFWKIKSTGQKIAASLALALGGFGAALAGGRNTAADIIQQAIKNDIDAQESDLLNKQKASKLTDNQLSRAFQRIGDLETAKLSVERLSLQRVNLQVEKIKAAFGPERSKADADKLKAELELQQEELRRKEKLKLLEIAQKQRAAELTAIGKTPRTDAGLVSKEGLSSKDLGRFVASINDPNVGVLTNAPAEKNRIIKTREFVQNARDAIIRMKELQEQAGFGGIEVLDRSLVKAASSVGEGLVLQVKDLFALGALQQHERALIEQIVPANIVSLGELLGINTAKMNELSRLIDNMEKNVFSNAGVIDPDKPITGRRKEEAAATIDSFRKLGSTSRSAAASL